MSPSSSGKSLDEIMSFSDPKILSSSLKSRSDSSSSFPLPFLTSDASNDFASTMMDLSSSSIDDEDDDESLNHLSSTNRLFQSSISVRIGIHSQFPASSDPKIFISVSSITPRIAHLEAIFAVAFTSTFFPAQRRLFAIIRVQIARTSALACALRRSLCSERVDTGFVSSLVDLGAGERTFISASSINASQAVTRRDQDTSSRASIQVRTRLDRSFSSNSTPKPSAAPPVLATVPPSSQTSSHSEATFLSSSFRPRNASGRTRLHQTSLEPPSLNCVDARTAIERSAAAAALLAAGSLLVPPTEAL
mmetsp:Transcript_454/g.1083  ORF Transcript_454/g.1083 Transcript_454/m.1083 type:complete len:306 (+) Transcript_454:556-1473(+)